MAGRNVLIGLTVALALWALYHALGSYFGGMGQENLPRSVWRSVVVIGCMAAFLGFWWILLWNRKRHDSQTDR
jgi:membrane protein DedA with SNARE-associated domain